MDLPGKYVDFRTVPSLLQQEIPIGFPIRFSCRAALRPIGECLFDHRRHPRESCSMFCVNGPETFLKVFKFSKAFNCVHINSLIQLFADSGIGDEAGSDGARTSMSISSPETAPLLTKIFTVSIVATVNLSASNKPRRV